MNRRTSARSLTEGWLVVELGLDLQKVREWFVVTDSGSYLLANMAFLNLSDWASQFAPALRKCYISDIQLEQNCRRSGRSKKEAVESRLPDAGSTMSGDFGEVLTFCYQAAFQDLTTVVGPKKWKLKQDRTKPAPHVDVIQFSFPKWPSFSPDDKVLSAEVKTKATKSKKFHPIREAISGCEKDRLSRLARTLTWLRERAINEELGSVKIEHLDRFIDAINHPPMERKFSAVAVVSQDLLADELPDAPQIKPPDFDIVVIVVPSLKDLYTRAFAAVSS